MTTWRRDTTSVMSFIQWWSHSWSTIRISRYSSMTTPGHTLHVSRRSFAVACISVYSPDCLQYQLGRHLANRNHKPGNRQQLVAALQAEWANMPQDSLRRLIRSMCRRCTSCVEAHDDHIPCWQFCDFPIGYLYHGTTINDSVCTFYFLVRLFIYLRYTCVKV